MTAPIDTAALRVLCEVGTAGAIDVHRFDDDAGEIRYQLQSAKAPFRVLGYAHDGDGSPRAKADAALWAVAREGMLQLCDELDRLRAARLADARHYERAMAMIHEAAGCPRDGIAGIVSWCEHARSGLERLRHMERDLIHSCERAHLGAVAVVRLREIIAPP